MFEVSCPNIPDTYYSQKELKHFGVEILVIHGILDLIVLNIFKYIFWCKCIKIEKFLFKLFTRIFELYHHERDLNTLKLYTLKALLSKNRLHFLFLIHHLLGCHAIGINSSLIFIFEFFAFFKFSLLN